MRIRASDTQTFADKPRTTLQLVALLAKGRSYRSIGHEVGLSKNTVADIIKRHRAKAAQIA